jgi:hypothetical protein
LIKNQIIDLQDQISQIDINPTVEEVNIGTCIATARPVSQAVVSVAADLCDYKETVGQVVDIQSAIAKQPAGLNTLLGSVTGWDLSPDKLASSFGNLWLAYTNLLNRVSYMELNCCKISCDSVKVGYIVSIEGTTCTLSFTTGAGTSIPTGFTDCGSVLTISNESNTKSFSVNVIVTQGVTTGSIDLSGFTVGENLSFNLAAKLCSESLNCDKCVTKTVKYTTGGCCVITNEGDDNAVIVYETLLTSN